MKQKLCVFTALSFTVDDSLSFSKVWLVVLVLIVFSDYAVEYESMVVGLYSN